MSNSRVVAAVLILAGGAMAQTDAHPEFEVASIKPAAPDARGMFIRPGPGGGISITNMTLKEMMVIAWRVQPFQISGGPGWIDSVHHDITAKPEAKTTPDGTFADAASAPEGPVSARDSYGRPKSFRSMRWCW